MTNTGTTTVTMSTSRPSPKISPNVHTDPSTAGTIARALRRRSPMVA